MDYLLVVIGRLVCLTDLRAVLAEVYARGKVTHAKEVGLEARPKIVHPCKPTEVTVRRTSAAAVHLTLCRNLIMDSSGF